MQIQLTVLTIRLYLSPIGIIVYVADWMYDTQVVPVRVDHIHEFGVVRVQSLFPLRQVGVLEERGGRIQTGDSPNFLVHFLLQDVGCHPAYLRPQTVADKVYGR